MTHEDRIIKHDGYRLYLHPEQVGSDVLRSLLTGAYEREEAQLVREYLPSDVDVIELGAGLGYVSCVIDETIRDDRVQIAIEPNPMLVPWLERTRVLNDAGYTVREQAYSATANSTKLDIGDSCWTARTSDTRGVDVPAANLAQIREEEDLELFALVMDVEGAEYELLTAELALLEARCSHLIVEFHDSGPQADAYSDDLAESSFELLGGTEAVCSYRNPAVK